MELKFERAEPHERHLPSSPQLISSRIRMFHHNARPVMKFTVCPSEEPTLAKKAGQMSQRQLLVLVWEIVSVAQRQKQIHRKRYSPVRQFVTSPSFTCRSASEVFFHGASTACTCALDVHHGVKRCYIVLPKPSWLSGFFEHSVPPRR